MTAAEEARDGGAHVFAAQIECCLHRGQAGEGLAYVPILVAQVREKPVSPPGIATEWPGEGRHQTALLTVPAEQRNNVDRAPVQVEVFRINLLIRKPPENCKQLFKHTVAQSVSLLGSKQQVELSIRQRLQIEMINRKDFQAFYPAFA